MTTFSSSHYLAYFSVPRRERSTPCNHCATTSTSFLTRMFCSDNSFSFTLPWLLSRLFRNIDAYRISNRYIYMALWHIKPKFTVRCGPNVPFWILIFLQAFCFDAILHVLFHDTYETATCVCYKISSAESPSNPELLYKLLSICAVQSHTTPKPLFNLLYNMPIAVSLRTYWYRLDVLAQWR